MAVLIYELVNPALRETFVGMTTREPAQIAALIQANPPPSIAHWAKDALKPIREVETFASRAEAEQFLAGYISSLHQASAWKVFCEEVLGR